jgi:hypothetical protein
VACVKKAKAKKAGKPYGLKAALKSLVSWGICGKAVEKPKTE